LNAALREVQDNNKREIKPVVAPRFVESRKPKAEGGRWKAESPARRSRNQTLKCAIFHPPVFYPPLPDFDQGRVINSGGEKFSHSTLDPESSGIRPQGAAGRKIDDKKMTPPRFRQILCHQFFCH
jgi:hypothetical protein